MRPSARRTPSRRLRFFQGVSHAGQFRAQKCSDTNCSIVPLILSFCLAIRFCRRDTIPSDSPSGSPHPAAPTRAGLFDGSTALYVRTIRVPSSNGSTNEYVRVVEAFREDGKVKQRTIADLGRKDLLLAVLPQLQRI